MEENEGHERSLRIAAQWLSLLRRIDGPFLIGPEWLVSRLRECLQESGMTIEALGVSEEDIAALAARSNHRHFRRSLKKLRRFACLREYSREGEIPDQLARRLKELRDKHGCSYEENGTSEAEIAGLLRRANFLQARELIARARVDEEEWHGRMLAGFALRIREEYGFTCKSLGTTHLELECLTGKTQ